MTKKRIRNICIWVIAVVLVLVTTMLINFYPLLNMAPVETGIIDGTEITAIKNNKNDLFVISSDSGHIVIDAGTSKEAVENALKKTGWGEPK